MFLAKFLDQKQGEARVVDQQQALRERLDRWLKARPSPAELAERGILGRGQRFALASAVVDRLLRARLQAQEEERARIPAGKFAYTDRLRGLLEGPGGGGGASDCGALGADELAQRLRAVASERAAAQAKLDAAADAWAESAEACRRAAHTRGLLDSVSDAGRVLRDLEAHHAWTGSSLAGVFEELNAFQRLVARKYGLQRIIAVLEKTEAVRVAAFAWGSTDKLPLSTLEELPGLCANLPARSRAIGVSRLQFVIGPIRTALVHSLQEALQATGRWPLNTGVSRSAPSVPRASAEVQVIQLCEDLQRVQCIEREVQKLACPLTAFSGNRGKAGNDEVWACTALAAPLIARFRHHFWRPESELCRMDKPDWAFRYLIDLVSEHLAELERWMATVSGQTPEGNEERSGAAVAPSDAPCPVQLKALQHFDLPVGLSLALAREAQLFVRARMPLLVPLKARPLLLQTIHHFVRFHSEISTVGGSAAGAIAFEDFDRNRPVSTEEAAPRRASGSSSARPEGSSSPEADATASGGGGDAGSVLMAGISHLRKAERDQPVAAKGRMEEDGQADSKIGKVGARLMAGLSHLRPLAPVSASAEAAGPSQDDCDADAREAAQDHGPGCLDVWAAADAEFLRDKIAAAAVAGGSGWQPNPLHFDALPGGAPETAGPQAAELATLLGDLFERARERAECLASSASRAAYARQVLDPALLQTVAAVRGRWNAMKELLRELQEASLLIETLEELCRFLDGFPFAIHIVAAVDEANTVRLSMIEALVSSLEEPVRRALHTLSTESCVFSSALAPPLATLAKRLRPSSFLGVARQVVARLATTLVGHLLRQSPFRDGDQLAIFVANCRGDLEEVLAAVLQREDLEPLRPLWDGCALLSLPVPEATELLPLLREAAHRAPGGGAALHLRPDLAGAAAPEEQRPALPEALARAGVQALAPPEALGALAKRPDLAGAAADLPAAPLGALQELWPVSVAQTTLQLGAGALQQLGTHGVGALHSLGAQAPLPSAGVQASLHMSVADLKGLAGGAGRLLSGKLRSTLGASASSS